MAERRQHRHLGKDTPCPNHGPRYDHATVSRGSRMDSETLGFMPATEAAELIRTKKLSPVEYMGALLERITALEPKVNAFAHLAADQAAAAGGIGEFADERVGEGGLRGVALGEETEGVGEERVAGEEGGGFVELFVRRGPAAAQVVVIHARKVVVDERVGVDALDGDGGGQGVGRTVAEQLGGGEDEDGAEAFAAGFEAVAHRGVEARRARRRGREVEVEAAFDGGDVAFEFGGEVHWACREIGGTSRT